MATWPITLPAAPLAAGYVVEPGSQVLRSDMEVGPARVRRITSARNDQVSLSVELSAAQVQIFRNWFDGDLAGGSNWFVGLSLDLDGTITAPECRFVGPYSIARVTALLSKLTAKVEVR